MSVVPDEDAAAMLAAAEVDVPALIDPLDVDDVEVEVEVEVEEEEEVVMLLLVTSANTSGQSHTTPAQSPPAAQSDSHAAGNRDTDIGTVAETPS
jgi:hypothetical protein